MKLIEFTALYNIRGWVWLFAREGINVWGICQKGVRPKGKRWGGHLKQRFLLAFEELNLHEWSPSIVEGWHRRWMSTCCQRTLCHNHSALKAFKFDIIAGQCRSHFKYWRTLRRKFNSVLMKLSIYLFSFYLIGASSHYQTNAWQITL